MRVQLLKWQMQLDLLSLRERGLIGVVIIIAIVLFWSSFIFDNEQSRLKKIQREIVSEQKQIGIFNQQKQRILNDATSQKTFVLRSRHKSLRQRISALDGMMKTYQQRTVSEQQLAVMLYAVLKDMQGLKIISFSSHQLIQKKEIMSNEPSDEPTVTTDNSKVIVATVSEHIQPKYYVLKLEGNYFSVQSYLNRLEQLSWKLYWDKFDYQVKQFPLAVALIQFHTLSIEHD